MKKIYSKRKIQSILIVVFCFVFINKVPSWLVGHSVQYLISRDIFIQQIHRLGELNLFSTFLSIVENTGVLVVSALILFVFRKAQSRVDKITNIRSKDIFQKSDVKRLCLFGIMGAGAAQVITLCLIWLPLNIQSSYASSMSTVLNGSIACILFIIAHIIIVPAKEEIVFRGLYYEILRSSWEWKICSLLVSFLFAGIHRNKIQIVYAFFMGVLLCVIRELYGSVLYTIAFHLMFNLSGSGIFLSEYREYLMYIGTIVFIISLILFVLDTKKGKYIGACRKECQD